MFFWSWKLGTLSKIQNTRGLYWASPPHPNSPETLKSLYHTSQNFKVGSIRVICAATKTERGHGTHYRTMWFRNVASAFNHHEKTYRKSEKPLSCSSDYLLFASPFPQASSMMCMHMLPFKHDYWLLLEALAYAERKSPWKEMQWIWLSYSIQSKTLHISES